MKATLGIFALAVGASCAGVGIFVLVMGLVTHDERQLVVGRRFLFGVLAAAAVAAGAMEWALVTHDYSLKYVAENNARATPLLFTVVAMSAAAGAAADLFVARYDPRPATVWRFRLFGACVPFVYFATYFIVTAAADRIWWDWNVVLGALMWAAVIGWGLGIVATPQAHTR